VHGAANAMLHDRHGKSVHGGGNYWRILRAAATAAKWHNRARLPASFMTASIAMACNVPRRKQTCKCNNSADDQLSCLAGSVHTTNDYLRWVGRTDEERAEQRKAARLCLDTSAHAGSEYRRLVTVLSNVRFHFLLLKSARPEHLQFLTPLSCLRRVLLLAT
jgi:hypothetical protein